MSVTIKKSWKREEISRMYKVKFTLSAWHTELYFHCFETPTGRGRNNGFPQLINWRLSVSKLVTVTCFFVLYPTVAAADY